MAQVLINEDTLKNIADAIRGINGLSKRFKPSEMAAAIEQEACIPFKCISDITVYTKETCPYDVVDFTRYNVTLIRDYFCYRSVSTSSDYVGCGSGMNSYIANRLIFPHAVKVGGWAFYKTHLGGIEIPVATELGKSAFCGSQGFETIEIPKVKLLGSFSLSETSLKKIIIPDGVEYAPTGLFNDNFDLEYVVYGKNIKTLYNHYGSSDSRKFTKIKALYFRGETPPGFSGSGSNLPLGSSSSKLKYNICVPIGSVSAYQTAFNSYSSSADWTFIEMHLDDMPHYDEYGHAVWNN